MFKLTLDGRRGIRNLTNRKLWLRDFEERVLNFCLWVKDPRNEWASDSEIAVWCLRQGFVTLEDDKETIGEFASDV